MSAASASLKDVIYGQFCGPCVAKLTRRQVIARAVVQVAFVVIFIILFAVAISGFSSFSVATPGQVVSATNASEVVYILGSTSRYVFNESATRKICIFLSKIHSRS